MRNYVEVRGLNKKIPKLSLFFLSLILVGCVLVNLFVPFDPYSMNLDVMNQPPGKEFLFGTDGLGRDVFAMVWYGGRRSLFIGVLATTTSTVIAVIYGCIAGLGTPKIDKLCLRITDLLLSVPQVLLVIFVQGILGEPDMFVIALVIGLTGWMEISKIVRSEVHQIKNSDSVLAAKTMGGSFFYILWYHLRPNFMSAILFMVVTNLSGAIFMEATLSFLGIGLPLHEVSWGTLLALSQKAMLSGQWWILVIPGLFLSITLITITDIGEYLKNRHQNETYL